MPTPDWNAKKDVRISQVSETEKKNIQEHHKYFFGCVPDRNRRVKGMIYPAVGDIIEEDEENSNAEEEASAREKEKQRQSGEQQKRENVIVTSGGLIFLAIAALLVTASFLISPDIYFLIF